MNTAGRAALPGWGAAVIILVLLSACTTTGSGSGTLGPAGTPVAFSWISQDGGYSGTMTAAIVGDGVYRGPYLQMTSTAQVQSFEPFWRGWRQGWSDWGFPYSSFITVYSVKAVAN